MTITDADRFQLHQCLIDTLGEKEAATLMEHLPPVGWAEVATKTDLDHLRFATATDIGRLQAAMETEARVLREEVSSSIAKATNKTLYWMVGTIIGLVAAMGGATGAVAALVS